MQIGNIEFRPTLFTTVIAIVVLCILLSLGFWQLNRADQKSRTLEAMEATLGVPEVFVDSIEFFSENKRFRHVSIKGEFQAEQQYLLDNRIYKGQPGYLVVTPFKFGSGNGWLLVNRGWVPLGLDRNILPAITVKTNQTTIAGVISDLPGKLPSFGIAATPETSRWPKVVRDIEIDQISQQLGYTMPPIMLQLEQSHEAAYIQNWQPLASGPDKNRSYAIQWFAMALVLGIIYIGLNCRRHKSSAEEE